MTSSANTRVSSLANIAPKEWNLNLSRVPQFLIWEASFGLLIFDLLRLGRNFSRMHRYIRSVKQTRRAGLPEIVNHVCTAVNYASVWYPKRILCLQRAAVTTWLLRHHGVAATMVMGSQALPFKAHAWTEVNGWPVNERRNVLQIYQVWERC